MKDKYVFNSVFSLERYCNGWAGMTHLFSIVNKYVFGYWLDNRDSRKNKELNPKLFSKRLFTQLHIWLQKILLRFGQGGVFLWENPL